MEYCMKVYDIKKRKPQTLKDLRVKDIRYFLSDHYADSSLSLNRLSDEFKTNKNDLSSVFREATHISIKRYLNYLRINKACEILAQGRGEKVKEVAVRVGFSCVDHFIRVFEKFVGTTPAKYRLEITSANEYVEMFDKV